MAAHLAQLVERRASVAGVVGSNPTLGALFPSYIIILYQLYQKKYCEFHVSL